MTVGCNYVLFGPVKILPDLSVGSV